MKYFAGFGKNVCQSPRGDEMQPTALKVGAVLEKYQPPRGDEMQLFRLLAERGIAAYQSPRGDEMQP